MKRTVPLWLALLFLATHCGPYRPRPTPLPPPTPLPLLTLGPTATLIPTTSRKPTVTLTPTVTPTPIIYVVKKGDILGQIALDHNISVEAIMLANGIENPHLLSIGQKLLIPDESMLEDMARRGFKVMYATPTPAFPTPTLRPFSIAWDQVAKHVDEEVSVEGLVVRTRKAGEDVYLCFHDPPQGYLSIRIPGGEMRNFASQPEIYYLDHWIMVKGIVERANTGWQITVQKRSQISVLQ